MQLEFGEQRITVAAQDIVIGSGPGATVRLAGAGIRPTHALVRRFGAGLVVISPADDTAEVRVNGRRVGREPAPLAPGDRIAVGEVEGRVLEGVSRSPAPGEPASVGRLVSLTDGREYRLEPTPVVMGRGAGAAVVLTSPDASRRHAEVVSGPEGDVLVDVAGQGTFVNGDRLTGRHPLRALDVIRIGAEEFRYYPPARPAPPAPAAPAGAEFRLGDTLAGLPRPGGLPAPRPAAAAVALAAFLVRRGQRKGERLTVRTPVITLGRGDFNEVRLPDASVSTSHARIQLREGVWVIADLGSTNGTAVDGEPVAEETPLTPGCTLRLGDVDLLFEPLDAGGGPAPAPAAAAAAGGAPPAPDASSGRPAWYAVGFILLLAALAAWALLS